METPRPRSPVDNVQQGEVHDLHQLRTLALGEEEGGRIEGGTPIHSEPTTPRPSSPVRRQFTFTPITSASTSSTTADQSNDVGPGPGHFPPEIILLVLSHLSLPSHPTPFPSSDPHLELVSSSLPYSSLPTLAKPPSEQIHETLRAVSLVNKTWGEEGQKVLWEQVGFGTPKNFESVLRTVEEYRLGRSMKRNGSRGRSLEKDPSGKGKGTPLSAVVQGNNDSGWSIMSGDTVISSSEMVAAEEETRGRRPSITLDDLPTWSDDSKWGAMMGSGRRDGMMVDDGTPDNLTLDDSVLRSLSADSTPLLSLHPLTSPFLSTRILSFSRFRTAGLRRSLRQSSHERFVTPHRLLFLLRGTRLHGGKSLKLPERVDGTGISESESEFEDEDDDEDEEEDTEEDQDADEMDQDHDEGSTSAKSKKAKRRRRRTKPKAKLEAVGFTEFMDSAISRRVIEELLFRGGYLAEYEEEVPIEYHHGMEGFDIPPSPRPGTVPMPAVTVPPSPTPFVARQLQPSRSRSRSRPHHRHGLTPLSPTPNSDFDEDTAMADSDDGSSMLEFEEEEVGAEHEGEEDEEEERGRSRGLGHALGHNIQPPKFQRRSSGSAFAAPNFIGGGGNVDDTAVGGSGANEETEERGRAGPGAARGRRGRSLLPPSSYSNRSSSVPAAFLQRSSSMSAPRPRPPPRALSIDTERSSSVPASVRRGMYGKKRLVRVLEGSTEVRAIRALDLCGCVSTAFVTALGEVIRNYGMGPKGLVLTGAGGSITTIGEDGEDSEDDAWTSSDRSTNGGGADEEGMGSRKLKKVLFPHLRRLGLASSLLPASHLVALVLSFPFLTHLDLTSTLASPIILKYLALAGQSGPGGRKMRLKALSLARCRLLTGAAIVGLFCGDCPPFTSTGGLGLKIESSVGDDDDGGEDESWGSGEVVADLVDLSLYGDSTYPSPLSPAELRLVLTISPAFTGGHLRTIDLSSTPLTDSMLLDHFPPQPHLIELGLANCRFITIKGIASFLIEKAPGVEVLDLSHSCPAPAMVVPSSTARRATTGGTHLSIMELHAILLSRAASSQQLSWDENEAEKMVTDRRTNLRVVELDEKALEAVQGGAGDWKAIWGKGRRGWYVDTAVTTIATPSGLRPRTLIPLARDDTRRQALLRLSQLNGVVPGDMGWHPRKMEVLIGEGLMGREDGLYAFHAYQI